MVTRRVSEGLAYCPSLTRRVTNNLGFTEKVELTMNAAADERIDSPRKSWPFAHLWIGSVALAIFVFVAILVEHEKTQSFDNAVLLRARSIMDHVKFMNRSRFEEIIRDLTALGGYTILAILVFGMVFYLALSRRKHLVRFLLISIFGGLALMLSMKVTFGRTRPDVVEHKLRVTTASFPSGHSMMSMVVYLTLGTLLVRISRTRALKIYSFALPVFVSVLVGCSRIFIGVHYPTDVLAGWMAGLTWVSIVCLVTQSLERKGIVRFDPAE